LFSSGAEGNLCNPPNHFDHQLYFEPGGRPQTASGLFIRRSFGACLLQRPHCRIFNSTTFHGDSVEHHIDIPGNETRVGSTEIRQIKKTAID
jgi:hypothetical protein